MTIHAQRLLNVARALRESPDPGSFDMDAYMHPCGTPACALGHYAARTDLQGAFVVLPREGTIGCLMTASGSDSFYDHATVCEHFGITFGEANLLFSHDGCNRARSARVAAKFIESFVAQKWPETERNFARELTERLVTAPRIAEDA
jgi:hypothetical protein